MSETKSADEIVKEIKDRLRDVWKYKENPEELSRLGNELVVLNFAMGQWLIEFDDQEREAKTALDLQEADTILELVEKQDHKVNRAELKAKVKLGDDRRAYNQIVNAVTKVKIVRNDTDKALDMLRTRISLIKGAIEKGADS